MLAFCLGNVPSQAQSVQRATLTGRITNATDGQALPFASVYLNGTTKGTTADQNGQFTLTDVPFGAIELVASYTGFSAVRQAMRITEARPRPVAIALLSMTNMLAGVVITAKKDKTWTRQLEQFERDLLGESSFARQCTLINPDVLQFEESGGTLTATASEALRIENQALGFQMTYTLLGFRSQAKTGKVVFGGTTLFRELTPESPKQTKQWQRNRILAYQGSLRHLLASLAANTYEQEGFMVYQTDPAHPLVDNPPPSLSGELGRHLKPFNAKLMVTPGTLPHERWLVSASPLDVFYTKITSRNSPYRDAQYAFSQIVLPQLSLGFTVNGQITSPRGFEAVGYLSNDRLANSLPDDWQTDAASPVQPLASRRDSTRSQEEIKPVAESTLDSLVQRWKRQPAEAPKPVFVQINKPLYMTGERLWLSGYLLDARSRRCDSAQVGPALSVELVSASTNRLVQHQWLPVETGRTSGSFQLSDTLTSGTYWLRAYTEVDRLQGKTAFERPFWIVNPTVPLPESPASTTVSEPIRNAWMPMSEYVEEAPGAPYRVTVNVDSAQFSLTLNARLKTRFQTVYVLVESRGRLALSAYVPVRAASTTMRWSTRTWPTGTAWISLMDSTGRIWAKRSVRVAERAGDIAATITTTRAGTFGQPEGAVVVSLHDDVGRPVVAQVSVSVADAALTPSDSMVPGFADYLMILDSRRVTQPIPMSAAADITLHGQVSTTEKHPVNVVLLATGQQGIQSRSTQTDAGGHFQVRQLSLADSARVMVQVTNRRGKPVDASVTFPVGANLGLLPFWPDAAAQFRPWKAFIELARQRQLADTTRYRQRDARQLREVVVRTNRPIDERPADIQLRSLHSQIDQTIILNKDTPPFENLYLLMRAKVPVLRVDEVLAGGRTAYSVSFPGASSVMNSQVAPVVSRGAPPQPTMVKAQAGIQNPLFLIDGFPIDDTDGTQLLSFSPTTIERIEVLKSGAVAAMYGTQASKGVIAFYTKTMREAAKAKGVSQHLLLGYPASRPFPKATSAAAGDVLAWEPIATTDQAGQLQIPLTIPSTTRLLRVTIQGVSADGQPIYSVQTVSLKPH
ncbi:carboxypeptidase-like regulatory domain-containing protein [Fibrella forsythiae]|uniref:Carboxypeptidase-like regulatory domain-containing protein n=1 Tax=Fibrella forsythiae TaxID=2817061 RepID=A0ABS3JCD6_9BACT|nr:carboxypeptidase-like regulatory domain-containing protein [Fibrella forsythiae]MBO0947666.1 carboxypeptidase-like regulatory domain-containing protein [Fibrella forsythiae]